MLTKVSITTSAALVLAVASVGVPLAQAQTYRLDPPKDNVIALMGLTSDQCQIGSPIAGVVAQRSFDASELFPASFVIEVATGQRHFVNVDVDYIRSASVPRVDMAWIVHGLQTILRVGRPVHVGVRMCGASGGVWMLNNVYPTGS